MQLDRWPCHSLSDYYIRLKNTTIEHSERLVTPRDMLSERWKDLTWPSKREWLLEKQPFKTIAVCRQVSAGWVEYLSPMEGTSPPHSSTPTKSPSMTSPKSSGQRCVSFSRLPQYGAGLPGDRLTIGILELFAILRCRILVVGMGDIFWMSISYVTKGGRWYILSLRQASLPHHQIVFLFASVKLKNICKYRDEAMLPSKFFRKVSNGAGLFAYQIFILKKSFN